MGSMCHHELVGARIAQNGAHRGIFVKKNKSQGLLCKTIGHRWNQCSGVLMQDSNCWVEEHDYHEVEGMQLPDESVFFLQRT